jgi:hypothetical protein
MCLKLARFEVLAVNVAKDSSILGCGAVSPGKQLALKVQALLFFEMLVTASP